jgi:hypothetical protein
VSRHDQFDLGSLAVPREVVEGRLRPAEELENKKPRRLRSEAAFIKIPLAWVKRLMVPKLAATYTMAVFLQYRNWKRPGEQSQCRT